MEGEYLFYMQKIVNKCNSFTQLLRRLCKIAYRIQIKLIDQDRVEFIPGM